MSDYEDFLEELANRESDGQPDDGYGAQNPANYIGRWQFGEGALVDTGYVTRDGDYRDNDYSGGWTGKDGVTSLNDFLANHTAQDNAIDAYMKKQWDYIRHLKLDNFIGETINGIEITPSGLLGGAHLVGTGGLRDFLRSNGSIIPEDGNGTPITEYIDDLGGYDIPFDDPPAPPESFGPPEPLGPHVPPGWVSPAQEPWNLAPEAGSPLVLDLDGDGIELTTFDPSTTGTFFDIDGDNFSEQTAWITANQDGLLVRDLNDNDQIDGVNELFGSPTIDGFALLASLDSNGDHLFDQYDPNWSDLLIWKDVNGDAVTQDGELLTLASLNIVSIDLAGVAASTSTINGNAISHTSTFKYNNGSTGEIVDAWFTHDNLNTYSIAEYTLDESVLFLPTLRGFGKLPDLHIAMSMDEGLLGILDEFQAGFSFASFDPANGSNEAVTDILFTWAGVDLVNPNSRGSWVDGQRLEFLEEFFGKEFTQGGMSNPLANAGLLLDQSWTIIFENVRAQLLLQSGASELFEGSVSYNPITGEIDGDLALSEDAIINLEGFATDAGVVTEEYWIEVARFLDATKGFENLTVTENGWMNTSIVATDAGLSWTGIKALVDIDNGGATIYGTSGADTLTGTAHSEIIYGDDGNDTVNAVAGDDELYGNTGNDTLNGGAGQDTLYGQGDNDILDGGSGGDIVYGGYGDDTYVYASGSDLYYDDSGTDSITLPGGITSGDVTFYRFEDDPAFLRSLFIVVGTLGTIELTDHFGSNGDVSALIETLTFADTSTYNLGSFGTLVSYGGEGTDSISGGTGNRVDVIYGLGGDDYLYGGYGGNDTLDGGLGNDTLNGEDGDDTYIASPGFDVILESSGTDVIQMPADVVASDISFLRLNANADDLQITIDGLGQIIVDNYFISSSYAVEQIVTTAATITLTSMSIATIGTSGDDSMSGITASASTNDVFDGREGNDAMDGGAGNDIYYFSQGQDLVYESTGSSGDRVKFWDAYSPGDVTVYRGGYQGMDLIFADLNGNTLNVSGHFYDSQFQIESAEFANSTVWTISAMEIETRGTSGNDTFFDYDIGDASNADTIYGFGGNDDLRGGNGNDLIDGGSGDDYMDGGSDTDTLSYATATGGVTLNLATATGQNTGGAGTDTILNFENLTGSAYNDTLTGDGSVNIIEGGAGNDTMNAAGGTDTLSYEHAGSAITINLATTTGQSTGGAGTDTISNFENLFGSAYNDTLTGTSGNNVIEGGAGNDTINGQGGTDTLTYANAAGAISLNLATATSQNTGGAGSDTISNMENLTGSVYNDTLTGNSSANVIDGGDGNDTIEGAAGNDTLTGGGGTDTASYANAGSAVTVNLATLTAQNTNGAGTDTLSGFENLTGSAFNDTLTGNSSDNVIQGGAGNDTINGSGGTDTLSYANAGSAVTLNLSTGTSQNTSGAGSDTISSMENLVGSAYGDTLTGTSSANHIWGGAGADTISAGGGNDFLYGGAGADTLTGSTGGDVFVFEAATALGASDTITDFSAAQVDKLDVSDILDCYDPLNDAISDFVRITDNGTHSFLSVDADGGGNSFTQIAQLSSVTNIAAGATATEMELQAMITAGTLIAA